MSLIDVRNLTFAYEGSGTRVFENVTLQIDTDWKLGFIGRNGRGKTTFLNLLLGKYDYDGEIASKVHFDYFPFDVRPGRLDTIDVIRRILPGSLLWEIERELSLLQVDGEAMYRSFQTLSYGEQTKVLLASLFLRENNFLLIDEPTNHLDMDGRKTVSEYLSSKRGFILVSHDRAFLDDCVDHILSINKTKIDLQKGDFSSWWENKTRQDTLELSENEKLRKEIVRLSESARRTNHWSKEVEKTKFGTRNAGLRPDRGYIGHKAAKMMKRSKSIENRQQSAIEEKKKLLKDIEDTEKLKIFQLGYHGKRLAELEKVSIFYGSRMACREVSFTIDQGDRIALTGRNGSGKSSLVRLLRGDDIRYTGTFRKGSQLEISTVLQETSFLQGSLDDYAKENGVDGTLFRSMLRKLDFSRDHFGMDMSDFSAGQKKKVLIARSLCEKKHLHIWDEPLNFIDVFSRIQIEELLLEYSPTILFVEHDRDFCRNIATKTVEL
ncbi:MAG: ribosomal protection-like ABC-F family protein [Synergistales bacterium]